MKNIKHLLDIVDANRDHIALGLMSDPGLSKTSQINQWAEEHGRKVYEFITSQRMPSEISGMPMPVTDTKKMEIFDFDLLLGMEDGDVLFFDEFTNGNIMTLNACLTLIQDRRMLSGKPLPSIVVVAAGNPQGRCDLLPQTKQRFMWVDVKFDAHTWAKYIKETWGYIASPRLIQAIEAQYKQGFKSNEFNYLTARTAENLIRIAQGIGKDDPFWKTYDISINARDAVYDTLSSIDQLKTTANAIVEWAEYQLEGQTDDDAKEALNTVIGQAKAAKSWTDLYDMVTAKVLDDQVMEDVLTRMNEWLQTKTEEDLFGKEK